MPTPLPPHLSEPAKRALASAGITSLEQVAQTTAKELLKLHGLGPSTIKMLRVIMAEHKLTLK